MSTIDRLLTVATLAMLCLVGWQLHARGPAPTLRVGDRLPEIGVALTAPRSVLLVTSSTCAYCTASMPFYQRLAAVAPVVALTAEPVGVNEAYLASHGVNVLVAHVSPDVLHVRGTPTVLVVSPERIVLGVWTGKLAARDESAVLAALGGVE